MPLPIPPLNLNMQTASSADGRSQSAFDSSGMVVTIAGKGSGASTSGMVVAALVLGAVLWIARRKG